LETLLVITYTLFFIFLIQKLRFFELEEISKNTLSVIFIIKLFFGFLVWVVYTYYYTYRPTADVFKYFDASEVMFNVLKKKPIHFIKILLGIDCNGTEFYDYYDKMNYWNNSVNSIIYNDNRLIIRVNTIIRFFSLGYFHVHTVFFSFFSLVGLTGIYKTFIPVLHNKSKILMCIVFLIPSLLFWGSGVLKESLVLFSIGLLVYHFSKLFTVKSVVICIVMLALLAILKFYVLIALIPSLLFKFWVIKTTPSKLVFKFIVIISVIMLLGLTLNSYTSIKNPLQMLSQKQADFNKLANGLKTDAYNKPIPTAGSAIKINKMEPTFISFIENCPQALINTLFRPFIWESKSPIILIAAIENVIVITFIVFCIIFSKPFNEIGWEYVLFCLSFSITQLLFIGVTTPIVGAIVRYKIMAIPFLLIAFLLMLDEVKIKHKFSVFNKLKKNKWIN